MGKLKIIREAYDNNEITYDQMVQIEMLVASNHTAREKQGVLEYKNSDADYHNKLDLYLTVINLFSLAMIGVATFGFYLMK